MSIMTIDKIQENEQWRLQGDCTKCRRNSYCSKPCTRCNRMARSDMKKLVAKAMNEMTGGVMREAINKTVDGIW